MQLRQWQSECVKRALRHFYGAHRHFLCLATPGAGKSIMAAEVAARLFEDGLIDFVLCFSPSVNISQGMKQTFSNRLECRFDGVIGSVGCSYTYQGMLAFKEDFWQLLRRNRVLVVFDEIHHCAGRSLEDANVWGEEILLNIQAQAQYTLALTGTPWRSDQAPIVLSRYTDPDNLIQCDYVYGLKEAVADGVCRSPHIVLIDNDKILVTDEENETKTYGSLDELLKSSSIPYQSIIENHEAIQHILALATNKLRAIKQSNPNAAGLIVASSVSHAADILNTLKTEFNETAQIVTYKEDDPSAKINEFRNSTTNWIVSVGMISEGTDIPRLQVCCHLSRVKTELYFRQVLGRILRTNASLNQQAWLYTFAEPKLVEFASRIAEEIPDIPVIFSEPIEIKLKQELPEPLDMTVKAMSPSNSNILNTGRLSIDTQTQSYSIELLSRDILGTPTSLSFELLGGFREKVVSTFNSPF
ncbi:DEAD/DEAH box helicase family protein [Shewanella sp. SW36]|uniref:DEAD/DEAH box helicase n=2 Tax=Shewanella TaxID=22 RepID=UPI0021D88DCE|nr:MULTISPECIES: DEAD/DEAH box helicase family protein [unclassified Shewanella]MCU7977045.1 DEAD/DEAH box helicase family protein [Shewanella sp. SW36]MCU7992286.1 DEAD/DEAH box helicase family protein [Shewanella sp. SW1]MCU8053728.1 DEAD/DEAH box helicase family protein [Shewanella sp. SM43]